MRKRQEWGVPTREPHDGYKDRAIVAPEARMVMKIENAMTRNSRPNYQGSSRETCEACGAPPNYSEHKNPCSVGTEPGLWIFLAARVLGL